MQYLKIISVTIVLLVSEGGAYAASPPFIDYQWKVVLDACFKRATTTLTALGFKPSGATGSSEIVGSKGDYKAVIACIGEAADIAVFMVAGPNYKEANKLALQMKKRF